MKITQTNRGAIASRLRALRQAQFGALSLLSMSTLRALDAVENQAHNRITRETVNRAYTRADESSEEEQIGPSRLESEETEIGESSVLNGGERLTLRLIRPQSRGVVFKTAPAPVTDEPLPSDYVAAPVAPFVSAFDGVTLDATEEAAIKAEADAESAAILAQIGTDVAKEIEADKEARRAYAVKLANATQPAPIIAEQAPALPLPLSEHETLRLAVLAS